jgi:rhodanese-related sulfurtransferase
VSKSRWVIVIALASLAILVIAYGFIARPVAVDLATVSRAPFRLIVEEEGKTRVRDRFVISSPVAGFLRRVMLDVGDPVKRGQVVAELEPLRSAVLDPRSRAEAEAEVSAAEAAVRAAEENLHAAEAAAGYAAANHERTRKLFEAGYDSRDSLDQAESEARRTEAVRLSAEASLRVAVSRLDRARSTLRYSAAEGVADRRRIVPVVSPVAGTVLKLHRESEGVLNAGEPLVDVRSAKEYSGELIAMPNYPQEGATRGGHIPGAQNIPWIQATNEADSTFKSAEELQALYQSRGITPDRDIIAYCRIGERSSHTWFVLKYLLGYPQVRNYDGSWTEWGNLVNAPIEK